MNRYLKWDQYVVGDIRCWYAISLHFDYRSPSYANDTERDIEIGNSKQTRAAFTILMEGV